MYEELGLMEVGFFPPEEEAKLEEGFKQLKIAKRDARREARRKANEGKESNEPADDNKDKDDDDKLAELQAAAA
ncbi:hypothetical protein ACLOJK_028400 [Asimina triloba]